MQPRMSSWAEFGLIKDRQRYFKVTLMAAGC